jgi:hypothetical protein
VDWTKVVTDPLGLTGFALALVFGVVTVVARKRGRGTTWIAGAGFALATVCIVGGLIIAYRRLDSAAAPNPQGNAPVSTPAPASSQPSMRIDKIEQQVPGGAAVAGVQGNVTVNAPASRKETKPKE